MSEQFIMFINIRVLRMEIILDLVICFCLLQQQKTALEAFQVGETKTHLEKTGITLKSAKALHTAPTSPTCCCL